MKTLLKALLGIVVVFVLALGAIFIFTADMVTSADEFFAAVKNRDMEKAYTFLSEDFQASTSQADLEQFLEKNLIHKFREASWESRSINGGRGTLTGSITTESGGVVPITLNFVKGDNGWKIYSIQKPASGIQEEATPLQLPSENEQVALVHESTMVFAESVRERNMAIFHSHVSNLSQQQLNVETLEEAFSSFYGLDLTVLEKLAPTFNGKPTLDENGVMLISGFYPTKPQQLHFEHQYIYEGLGWKLMAFSVNIK